MKNEVLECEEFSEVSVRLTSLIRDGELAIDPRIAARGYLSAAFKGGQVVLRATKFVGLIPLTSDIAIRVKPRASINHLSYMLARSQKAASAISGFSRGYSLKFVHSDNVERLFGTSLVSESKAIFRRGLVKRYERPKSNTPWGGRFLASETVRKHASKGISFRHEFDQSILTETNVDNCAIKAALKVVLDWYRKNQRRSPLIAEILPALSAFDNVYDWDGSREYLVYSLRRLLSGQSNIRADYADALWSAYAILEQTIPDIDGSGKLNLDSLIIDVSEVFEAYLRRELSERLGKKGFKVQDGWKRPHPFFVDGRTYSVHPDMIIQRDGIVVAILDAKYKPDVNEKDRYEVLSFMDIMQANTGGFVCPADGNESSRLMGTTASGKRLHNLRIDLAALDPVKEAAKFAENVERMIQGRQDFL